uniref:NADH-ubiquinone oxidoreductase chain 4 n=1 Tax=Benedenia hoshinai TaxID=407255 RepID=E1U257_BENHO|nr:NADH dehydrogenase subunit 4 [Benedenia hoshinai]ABK58255.1 NADH dehydrogenase subunit 4 [Benedenia hoshinai]
MLINNIMLYLFNLLNFILFNSVLFILFNYLSFLSLNININSLSAFLSLVPLIFFFGFNYVGFFYFNNLTSFMFLLSIFSSLVCYNCVNNLLFWFFYELSILPLIYLKFRGSVYSERFNSLWYFIGYISLSSFPLLFILLLDDVNQCYIYLNLVLFILFIVKIPLPPFHSWLPVVHAEANSYVSIVLSGYIMKLGIIGVYRYNITLLGLQDNFMCLIFLFSLFFFINSFIELDTKRWLAFLSLSHILISYLGLNILSFLDYNILSYYCLGHGISAGLLFYLFFLLNGVSGSRNWLLINNVNNNSFIFRILLVISILTLASFPPTIQFISEIHILIHSLFNFNLILLYSFYLFIGGLVPLLLLSYLISRNNSTLNFNIYYTINFLLYLLIFYCFFLPIFN